MSRGSEFGYVFGMLLCVMKKDWRRIAGVVVTLALAVITALLWQAVFAAERGDLLTVSFLDVGQGDAIFIEAPSGAQVLIDGGPDGSALRALAKIMPWHDRTIDVVVATHPDQDHIGGLIDVFERYDIEFVLRPGVLHDTPIARAFIEAIKNEQSQEIFARRGHIVHLGDGARLEILFPDRDVSGVESNAGSVVARLEYGDTSFLFTGDAPHAIEKYLATLGGKALASDVLKVGHHGSKTSSDMLFLGFVSPQYGIISRGCGNRYGHPHKDVLDALARFDIEVLDTCEAGTVTFISDGSSLLISE